MVNTKIVKKNITAAMKELETALMEKQKPLVKKNKKTLIKNKKVIKKTIPSDILLLTNVIKKSPFFKKDSNRADVKKSIQSIIESDIKLWIKANMHIITDDYVKKALKTINYTN
tara:strand:+ start:112 stop:453 length:342 start_codon:yes stop_codon:yes gene_type:complete